jgi:type VI secretion system ImpM family protein
MSSQSTLNAVQRSMNGSVASAAMCFGKLPGFSDFVRVNAGTREVLQLDRWLQEGIYYGRECLRDEWRSSYGRAPTYCFAFHPASSQQVLVGLLVPSHDSSDRMFPFVVALQADRSSIGTSGVRHVPVVFSAFFQQAAEFLERTRTEEGLSQIEDAARRLRNAVDGDFVSSARESYAAFLERTSIDRMWREGWGEQQQDEKFLVIKNLADILTPLRGRNPERLAMGIRFRVPRQGPTVHQHVSFWLEVAHAAAQAGVNTRPFIFWTSPEANREAISESHLYVFLREPTARTFAYLLRPDLKSDFICELEVAGTPRGRPAREVLPAPLRMLLETDHSSLRELIRAIVSIDAWQPASARRTSSDGR